MTVAVFGCKNTTKFLIEFLSEHIKIKYLITIDEIKGEKFDVADYCDLTEVANKYFINVYTSKTYSLKRKEDVDYIKNLNIDISFVVGWQRLIPVEILNSMSIGSFGMHGSSMDLPLGRGRSPMNWSIIEGRKYFHTNLFKYDDGVDSGDILDSFKFDITNRDTSETMHFKNTLAMKYLIEKNLDKLLSNKFKLKRQRDIKPTYYPKRIPDDSLIDWSLDVYELERFIRAVTKPFNGAFTYLKNKVIIYDAQVFDISYYGYCSNKHGEIVVVFPNGKFLVKCSGGLLLVNDYQMKNDYIKTGKTFNNGNKDFTFFKKNKFGFFDLEE
ncbi:formyltransferase family protein [Candidatus Marinimicrobia bacterium]|nr:formyltransferase family protein [Candidatus Neomarinimicrobiota bacterium]